MDVSLLGGNGAGRVAAQIAGMRSTSFAITSSLLFVSLLSAQEHVHGGKPTPSDSARAHAPHAGMKPGPLGITMQREGSGTAWLPDASPMYAVHSMERQWELMLHGNAFVQFVNESSDRGASQLGLVNWIMGMASRPVANGRLGLRSMLSAEPITVGKCGYPDLLATGEFCKGEPLHDRQHPHDLFMELAAHYQQPMARNLAFELYGGPVGEPALGPVAYPHRISAMPGPLAPIGHHWQDATHIAFGVATAGVYSRRWKLEGSVFNGREPDEQRFDFDFGPLDSYSGRLWFLPNDRWALQASLGRLTEAEAPREPGEGRAHVTRATASATYHKPLGERATSASTLVLGQNRAHGLSTDAFLLESNLNFGERNIFFGRGELARKSGEDLVIEEQAPALGDRLFTVSKLAIGYVRQFGRGGALVPAIGAQISVNLIPSSLQPFYGNRTPLGLAVFASLRPRPMRMEHRVEEMPIAEGMHDRSEAHMQRPADQHAGHEPSGVMTDSSDMRLMHEIHKRMMADPVIRERVATDPVLQQLIQRMSAEMKGDTTGGHAGHATDRAAMDTSGSRQAIEFVTLLLSDPKIEARVRGDARLHRLWSDPEVQRCLTALRRLKVAGRPLPAACPAAAASAPKHPH
jgi:hypothetical protein